jgi:Flp pilus assembly protein TadD
LALHGVARREGRRVLGALLLGAALLATGGCAQVGKFPQMAAAAPSDKALKSAATDGRSELQKATEYWGLAYAKNPSDTQAALNYARNLKALGEKRQALAVLQQASVLAGDNRALNAEYGRLALEFDQISLAERLLQLADDPANPDWKVISARGTALAKQNRFREAIVFYDKALALAPEKASILNNLALAHAMTGDAAKAEELLKRAAAGGNQDGRITQNLAMVLGLQGKYAEAKLAGARNLPSQSVADNVEYLRQLVKHEPKELTAVAAAEEAKLAPTKNNVYRAAGELKEGLGSLSADPAASASGWTTQVATIKSER